MENRCANTGKIRWYVLSMMLSLMFIYILSRIYQIILISPDDISMKSIISGAFTGIPDGHCVFIRYPLAWLLSQFYNAVPNVEWYDLFFMGCHGLCVFLILCRAVTLKGIKRYTFFCICLAIMAVVWTKNIVNLEWTSTAGVLGMTAIFRYCTMPRYQSGVHQWIEFLIILVLLGLSFCIRHTVAVMYIPIAFICWVKRLYDIGCGKPLSERIKREYINQICFILLAILLLGVVFILHKVAYSSPDWMQYSQYTQHRSALFDYYGYPDYEQYAQEYAEAGISREMYALMRNDYNFVVPTNHFDNVDLSAIAKLAKSIYQQKTFGEKVRSFCDTFSSLFSDGQFLWTSFVVCVLIAYNIFVVAKQNNSQHLYVIALTMYFLLISTYLIFEGRFPIRVAICILYGLLAALAGNVFTYVEKESNQATGFIFTKILSGFVVFASLLIIVTANYLALFDTNQTQNLLAGAKNELVKYCDAHPDNIYFYDFWSFSQRGDNFMSAEPGTNYVRSGGWMYNSPVYDELQKKYDCYDLLEAIKANGNIYYLVSSDRTYGVATRLNAYYASISEPITVEITDRFSTDTDAVEVLRFRYN